MPTTTLGIVIDSGKLNDIWGVINATLGDLKPLFFLLMGFVIGVFVVDAIVGSIRKKKGTYYEDKPEAELEYYYVNDDELREEDDNIFE